MSGRLITEDPPRVYPNATEANKIASFLEVQEEDGWTYEVIVSPKSGSAVVAVFDEDNELLGYL